MKKQIATDKAPQAIGPYSQGVNVTGDFSFVSGQLPINAATGEMSEDVAEQTKQSLENMKAILEETGLTMDNVVKTTIFLSNMEDFAVVNEVYGSFFKEPFPSRSTIEVARLPKDAKVEIEAIAVK
ncbi:RidA family protein [Vagococcus carniphilus]|uniref:RidA family protein n=1 Tax=Vagococcus carniphilus TaxID=218144 RepID=A0AAW8U675_9ENTE|nr:RidA family protein [Vagococcus carniphilus]MDT2813940.1 RidA family protein [Vagococcus carniphilus]MDT2830490.1 RidA family protein [Vagococcus carniphilus]MDT2832525.1 RidA family protein [Vagococcus carniphilus]MDT2839788.1 RidA family protein [Vagococcus carniphilus]MDT2848066.1 RidA family protein [Vagococcus carniphilus]